VRKLHDYKEASDSILQRFVIGNFSRHRVPLPNSMIL